MNSLNWDNLRFFLAVARNGSLRAGAEELNVNHGTVNRRIVAIEKQLNTKLFIRLPTGYVLTTSGEEILESAKRVDREINSLRRETYALGAEVSGELRVTLPHPLARHLLMPDFTRFIEQYPGVDLEIISSYTEHNLTNREADVAIRATRKLPPGHLYGKQVSTFNSTAYASRSYLKKISSSHNDLSWIMKKGDENAHPWIKNAGYSDKNNKILVSDMEVQLSAAKANMGACVLPCFVGDKETDLTRLTQSDTHPTMDIWILTHKDLRNTPRVSAFTRFMDEAFKNHKTLIEGHQSISQ